MDIAAGVADTIFKFANEIHDILIDFHIYTPLEVAAALLAMPLLTDFPAGRTYNGHRYSEVMDVLILH